MRKGMQNGANPQPAKKASLWGFLAAFVIWVCWSAGAFFLSERFDDKDWILYPSVFIFVASVIVGPAVLASLLTNWLIHRSHSALSQTAVVVIMIAAYPVCFGLIILITRIMFRTGII